MAIVTRLDVMMARRKMSLTDLAARIGMSTTNLSLLKNGHVHGIRYRTMNALCRELDCTPGDLFDYEADAPGTADDADD